MTYEEALAILRTHKTYVGEMNADKLIEALNIAVATIEKQIPKQLNTERFTFVNGEGYFDMLCCPTCYNILNQRTDYGEYVEGSIHDYCEDCGQALDWGKPEQK